VTGLVYTLNQRNNHVTSVSNENNMEVASPPEPDRRREPYLGERRKFMREGYGTYVFENSFFRYEGEWLKGKKHGHGKLSMKDGTYYEGQFLNGEINGQGYKFFASSQAKYTGQFLNGEMHGHGIMTYRNGNCYEGQWYKNKKQGFGVLRTGVQAIYEGGFTNHLRDGEGSQLYDPSYRQLSNGDKFEGFWVRDQRHGQGELWLADGSHYVGEFLSDMFNGEGRMTHASGVMYQGLWKDGLPIIMATKMRLIVDESPLVIRQNKPFSLRVECQDDDDNIIPDMGRELQVMAGFRYKTPREGSALFDVIEDVEDTPIPTPFYDVVPYPLTDQPLYEIDSQQEVEESKLDLEEDKGEEEGEEEGGEELRDKEVTEVSEDPTPLADHEPTPANPSAQEHGAVTSDSPPLSPTENKQENFHQLYYKDSKADGVSSLPIPAATQVTSHGVCEWQTLLLAPPPPMYRPFAILEEEKGEKKTRIQKMREKIEDHEDSETEGNALPCEYVLIVNDVTNPPFMGIRLPPAHLMLKLKRPKKIVVKKPKVKK